MGNYLHLEEINQGHRSQYTWHSWTTFKKPAYIVLAKSNQHFNRASFFRHYKHWWSTITLWVDLKKKHSISVLITLSCLHRLWNTYKTLKSNNFEDEQCLAFLHSMCLFQLDGSQRLIRNNITWSVRFKLEHCNRKHVSRFTIKYKIS